MYMIKLSSPKTPSGLEQARFKIKSFAGYFRPGNVPAVIAFYILTLIVLAFSAPASAEDKKAEAGPAALEEAQSPDQAEAEVKPAPAASFGFSDVENMALRLAGQSYEKTNGRQFLKDISESKWNAISFKKENRLWANGDSSFEASFFHPGFIYNNMVKVEVVENGSVRPFNFSTDFFNYPDPDLAAAARSTALDFAGFRINYPLNEAEKKDEVLSFLGATHFRALAKRSQYGLEARGLIINPAQPDGEEFPYFRRFWLVKPEVGAPSLTIYALLDSPSLAGAYKFELSPGPTTIMDVTASFFMRNNKSLPAKIGLAPIGSMYLFSEKENGGKSDWRPEVHNSDILLWTDGNNNWFRRPLANPERLEITSFELNNPKGFGLMQQDNNFDHYQDFSGRFDLRPSLWVEPTGDWGPGQIELIEIPASQEIHNNIIAFWTPANEQTLKGRATIGYKLYWMPSGTIPHQLGRAVSTRLSRSPDSGTLHFLIDFEGGLLNDIPADSGLASVVEFSAEVPMLEKTLIKNPVTGGWRLEFKIKPAENNGVMQSLLNARGERKSLRLKALLKKGENLPEALTETWVYDLPY